MPAQTSHKLSRAEIANAMRKAGWPESAIPIGVAVALAESGGNPRAVNRANRNGSADYGLFQINSIHKSILASGDRYDPVDNARMALRVYKDAGSKWTPWSVYKSGSYRKFYTGKADGNPNTTIDPTDPDHMKKLQEGIDNGEIGRRRAEINSGSLLSLGFIGTQAFWTRFGIGLLALLLIIAGLWIIFRQPLTDVAKGLANVTPQGRALNLATGVLKK